VHKDKFYDPEFVYATQNKIGILPNNSHMLLNLSYLSKYWNKYREKLNKENWMEIFELSQKLFIIYLGKLRRNNSYKIGTKL
jgi:hypothetical protein